MTTEKRTGLPMPLFSSEMLPDNNHLLHQDAKSQSPQDVMSYGLDAMEIMGSLAKPQLTSEEMKLLNDTIQEILDYALTRLSAIPVPSVEGLDVQHVGDPTKPAVYLPYHIILMLHLVSDVGLILGKEGHQGDRAAAVSEFIRIWACFMSQRYAKEQGLDYDASSKVASIAALQSPIPIGMAAALYQARQSVRAYAQEHGISNEEAAKVMVDKLKADTQAGPPTGAAKIAF